MMFVDNANTLTDCRGRVITAGCSGSVRVRAVYVGDSPFTCCAAIHGGFDW